MLNKAQADFINLTDFHFGNAIGSLRMVTTMSSVTKKDEVTAKLRKMIDELESIRTKFSEDTTNG